MFWSRTSTARRVGIVLALVGVVAAVAAVQRTRAQALEPTFQLRMNGEQISALLDATARKLDYIPNEVLVKFKAGVGPSGQQRALMALRSRPAVGDLRWAGPVAVVTDLAQPNPAILAAQLREQPEVEYAEPNYLYHSTATPPDPSFGSRQWNMTAIDMPRAWDIVPGGSSDVIVAVLDTGVTTVNNTFVFRSWDGFGFVNVNVPYRVSPDLSSSRFVAPFDFFLTGNSTVLAMGHHGTHVASTIGEDLNNLAEVGVAFNTRIMPLKVLGCYWDRQFIKSFNFIPGFEQPFDNGCSGSNATIAAAVRYAADHGARVINMSLGGGGASQTLEDALIYAVSKGAFVAISSGNEYDEGNPIGYPGEYAETIDGVMAVGSVGIALKHAYYSSSGSHVEIAAPGGDQRADGASGGVWQVTLNEDDSDPETVTFPSFDRFKEEPLQGTSMAAPHVAGVAALIMSQLGPSATPALVEQIIKKTARPCGANDCVAKNLPAGRNDFFGAGLIQPRAALFGLGLRK